MVPGAKKASCRFHSPPSSQTGVECPQPLQLYRLSCLFLSSKNIDVEILHASFIKKKKKKERNMLLIHTRKLRNLENPVDGEPGRLQSMGSQRVRHN